MNNNTTLIPAPGAKRINAAYEEAQRVAENATQLALLCGQLLCEQRTALLAASPRNQHAEEADQFGKWLAKECPKISSGTAYRWMKAAERTASVLKLSDAIEVEAVPLSQALTQPGKARQLWLDFTADRTITDCLRDVIEGESPDHRIARAYNGKNAAGAGGGGNRKQWEQFAALKLKHLTTFLGAKLHQTQRALIIAAFESALRAWPRWILESIADVCKRELKLSDQERASREEI